MKPRAIATAAFIVLMFVSGGVVLRHFQVKHPPKHKEARNRDFRNEGMDGSQDWRKALPAERTAAIACIGGQLDAFRADDYDKAMNFQSTMLRTHFSSASMFRSMIRNGYPEFSNSKKVVYGDSFTDKSGRMISVQVDLTGANGRDVKAIYQLVREKDGYRVVSVENA